MTELTWLPLVLTTLAGGAGALGRFELATFVAEHLDTDFPLGTLAVNSVGSFLTGVVFALPTSADFSLVIGTGFLGGFTTFSTWMVETGRLLEDGPRVSPGLMNIVLMLACGLAGAIAGIKVV